MSKDYYSILGINKNATEDEIKKAYKKLCIQWHPDKWAGKSEEEVKKAEEMFKDINEANSVLSDPQKRQNYDMFGSEDGIGQGSSPFGRDPFEEFMKRFSDMETVEVGSDVNVEVVLTLKETFEGVSKNINVSKFRKCSACNGTGSADGKVDICPDCNGTGFVTHSTVNGNFRFSNRTVCPKCHGKGKKIVNKCSKCNGSGLEMYSEQIKVDFPAGIYDGAVMTIQGYGNSTASNNGRNGNLNIIIRVTPDKEFERVGNDIVKHINVNLLEAWCGCEKIVESIDGKKYKLNIKELTKDGTRLAFRGKGFPDRKYGDGSFIVVVHYEIPKKITKKQKELLEKFYKE